MIISVEDYIFSCNRTLDAMATSVARLNDNLVNELPPLADANSPFAIVTHALGACEWWTGHMVCGHPSDRVRAGEFLARGTTAELGTAIAAAKQRLVELAPELSTATELAFEPQTQTDLGREWTTGAALIHAYEELAQHLGHLEITADLLLGLEPMDRGRRAAPQSRAS